MLLTLASGSVTESLHLIQDLLISQLRLTGTCGYLSDGFCYTNTSRAFQTASVRHATFITCRSHTDSCSIRRSIKIGVGRLWGLQRTPLLFPAEVRAQHSLRHLPCACPKGTHFSARATLPDCSTLDVLHTRKTNISLDFLGKIEITPLMCMFSPVNIECRLLYYFVSCAFPFFETSQLLQRVQVDSESKF